MIYQWEDLAESTITTSSTSTLTMDALGIRARIEMTDEAVVARMAREHWMEASLPCIACGAALRPVTVPMEVNQPYGGVAFTSPGHYGSRVWDDILGSSVLEINICDECLLAAGKRSAVLHVTPSMSTPSTHELWNAK